MRQLLQVGLNKLIEEFVKQTASFLARFGRNGGWRLQIRLTPTSIIQDLYEKGRVDEVWDQGLKYLADPGLSGREKFHIVTYLRSAAYQRGNKKDLERIREELKRVAGEEYDGRLGEVLANRTDFEDGRPEKVLTLLDELREKGVALNSEKRFPDALEVHRASLQLASRYIQLPGFPQKDQLRRYVRIASHNVGDTAINLIRTSVSNGNCLGAAESLQLLGAERLLEQSLAIQKEEGREWGLTYQSYLQSLVLRRDFVMASAILDRVLSSGNPVASELSRILDGHPEEVAGLEDDPECALKVESLRSLANGVATRKTVKRPSVRVWLIGGSSIALLLLFVVKVFADNM